MSILMVNLYTCAVLLNMILFNEGSHDTHTHPPSPLCGAGGSPSHSPPAQRRHCAGYTPALPEAPPPPTHSLQCVSGTEGSNNTTSNKHTPPGLMYIKICTCTGMYYKSHTCTYDIVCT